MARCCMLVLIPTIFEDLNLFRYPYLAIGYFMFLTNVPM